MHRRTTPGEGVVLCNTSIPPPLGVPLLCSLTVVCSNFLEPLPINSNLVQRFPPTNRLFSDQRFSCVAPTLDATTGGVFHNEAIVLIASVIRLPSPSLQMLPSAHPTRRGACPLGAMRARKFGLGGGGRP